MKKNKAIYSLVTSAEECAQTAQYQQAIDLLMRAVLLFQNDEQWEQYVDCCHKIARNHLHLSQYTLALECLEKCLSFFNNKLFFKNSFLITTYNLLADTYECLRQIDEAIAYYQKALQLSLQLFETEKKAEIAEIYGNLGHCYHQKGDYEQTLTYQQKALSIYLQTLGSQHDNTAICYNNLGNCYSSKGDYSTASLFYKKALNTWLSSSKKEHQQYIANVYNNLAYCLHYSGKYQQAMDYYQEAVQIYRQQFGENHLAIAKLYNNIGKSLQLKGELQQSLTYYQKTLAIRLQLLSAEHPSVAQIYDNFGSCYTVLKQYDKALDYLEKALTINRQRINDAIINTLNSLNKIGHVYREKQQYQQAIPYFHEVLQKCIPNFNTKNIYNYPNLTKHKYVEQLLYALNGKASCLYYCYQQSLQEADIIAAYQHYECLIQFVDELRQSYKASDSQLILAQNIVVIYEKAILTALILQELQPKKSTGIFSFFEKSKSLVLLSNFKQKEARTVANIPSFLLEKEQHLRQKLTFLDKNIQKLELKTKITNEQQQRLYDLQSQHFDTLQSYQQLITQFEKDYPAYYQLKYNQKTASIKAVQDFCQQLSKDKNTIHSETCLIEYFVGIENIYTIAINSTDYQIVKTKKPNDFDELIEDFTYCLENALTERKSYIELAYELYQLLLEPILQSSKKIISSQHSALIIIPHGILSSIPFEALLYQKAKRTSQYTELPYLLHRYNISYHYSATLLLHCQKIKNSKKHTFTNNFIGFAPVYQHLSQENATSTVPYTTQNSHAEVVRGKNCLVLKHSEEEIKKIAHLLKEQPYFTDIKMVLHAEASEENFRQLSAEYQYIHIAAHGIVNEQQAELSGILFSPNIQNTDNENGMLYIADTYNLQLNADLVVLSCCETGIGRLAKGEGMMAINRGFLYAGANHVVYTLFKIPDQASAELMVAFYTNILKKENYSMALTLAKRQMLSNGNAMPSKWAGFVLIS